MQAPLIDVDTLTRNWWVVLIRGVAGVLFGIATFIAPVVSLAVLVLLFGAYALVDGVLAVVSAVRRRNVSDRWWMVLFEGLVGIAAGVVTLAPRVPHEAQCKVDSAELSLNQGRVISVDEAAIIAIFGREP